MKRLDLADDSAFPPKAEIKAALARIVNRLALELHSPQTEPPAWTDFEWRAAMAVSVMHGISGLLSRRLGWQGPAQWQGFLAEQRAQGALRLARTRSLLTQLDTTLREAGRSATALKGSALIDLGIYAPGERPMSDIDLLVRSDDFEPVGQLIEQLGYVPGTQIWRHREYGPIGTHEGRQFGEHEANPIKIELHERIAEKLPLRLVEITANVRSNAIAAPGLQPYPSQAALMLHLLFHAAGNLSNYGIRLIHLHDIAALAPRLSPSDWTNVTTADRWWLYAPLRLVACSFPGSIPTEALAQARIACPPLLRLSADTYRLETISISRFDTPVLPGVEWTGSPIEALRYLRARISPGRSAMAQLAQALASFEPVRATGWLQLSRWQRAKRWIGGNPPRIIVLYTLRKALQHRPASLS